MLKAHAARNRGALNLSRHTIADYVKQIYRKLNVSSRAEAALKRSVWVCSAANRCDADLDRGPGCCPEKGTLCRWTSTARDDEAGAHGAPSTARLGAKVTLLTQFIVREDPLLAATPTAGVVPRADQDQWRGAAHRAGAARALNTEELAQAVCSNTSLLVKVPVTAERLLLELGAKMAPVLTTFDWSAVSARRPTSAGPDCPGLPDKEAQLPSRRCRPTSRSATASNRP